MKIKPFTNQVQFIPKDARGKFVKGQIFPADHFEVTATDIASMESGASPDLVNPDGGGSGNSGGGGGISIEDLVPSLKNINPSQDQTVTLLEPTATAYSMTVSVEHNKIEEVNTAYQWQESTDGGSTWSDMSGETSATVSLPSGRTNAQTGYKYRCKIENPDAVQTPVYRTTSRPSASSKIYALCSLLVISYITKRSRAGGEDLAYVRRERLDNISP